MAGPRVSVGLPVYNGEPYIESTIESILAQDFSDFELLIGDNGSTDRTPEICAHFAARDQRVVVHRSPENKGAAWNYNRLVPLANGEFFKWAAHDDLLDPRFLGRCVDVLERDPHTVLAYTGVQEIDAQDRQLRAYPFPEHYADSDRAIERVQSVVVRHTMCYEIFGLVRSQQLATTSLIGAYWGSDRTLLAELAALGPFTRVPEVLFSSREHPARMRYVSDWTAWHDTARAGRPTLPTWRLLREFGRVLWNAPGSTRERLSAAKALAGWAGRRRGFLIRQLALWLLWASHLDGPILRRRRSAPVVGRSSTSL